MQKSWDKRYSSFSTGEEIPWRGSREEEIGPVLKKYAIKKGRALDLGCGYGDKTIYLAKEGFNVLGIDISEKAVETAKKRSEGTDNVSFISMDINELGKALERAPQFNLVLDLCSSHFLNRNEKERLINTLSKIMSKDGIYIMQTYIREENETSPVNISVTPQEVKKLYLNYFEILESKRMPSKYDPGAFLELYVMRKR